MDELIERARQAARLHRQSAEGASPDTVRVPAEAVPELAAAMMGQVQRSVEQIVPVGAGTAGSFWWRDLARDKPVNRFYLVPSGADGRQRAARHVADDAANGVSSVAVPVTGGQAAIPMSELWLIDDRAVVRHDGGSWLVTTQEREIARARKLLRAAGRGVDAVPPPGPELTGWLLRSADRMRQVAEVSCDGCSWRHGVWQHLRLFDMVSSPAWHAEFYRRHLRAAIHEGAARRILISGAADYTMLAFVLDAARTDDGEPIGLDVHVADPCPTPLLACRWFAAQHGVPITVHPGGLPRADRPFDLVTGEAAATIGAETLRPGGLLVTTVRLGPSEEDFDEFLAGQRLTDPVDDFELRLRERAEAWRDMLPIDLEDLAKAARQYLRRAIPDGPGEAGAIRQAFEDAGFELVEAAPAPAPGELIPTSDLRVVATRPIPERAR